MIVLLADADVVSVIFRSIVLIGLVLVALWGVLRFRRWLKEEESPSPIGFTLSDLRDLHRSGKMSTAEYERAKAQMLDGAKAMAARMPHPLSRPGQNKPPTTGAGET